MVTVNDTTLVLVLEAFERGCTFQEAADIIGGSRRLLFRWMKRSRDHRPGFFMIYKGRAGYWSDHVERVRQESFYQTDPDFADMSDDEVERLTGSRNRFILDANGNRIRRPVEEPEPLDDIEELSAMARRPPAHPTPDGPVQIMRASNPNDPPERRTNAPPELSTAEKERRHPRAYTDPNADLRPPERPSWAKPLRIDGPGRGKQQPPEEGRFTIATHTVSAAERRAGTISFDGLGIRRH